jgi:hypothetical protein
MKCQGGGGACVKRLPVLADGKRGLMVTTREIRCLETMRPFRPNAAYGGEGGASLEFKAIVIRDIFPVVLPNVSGTNIAGSRMRFAHGQCQDFEEKNSAKSIRFSCERCKACLCVQLAGITRFSGLVGRCMQHGRFQTPDKIHEAKATCRR